MNKKGLIILSTLVVLVLALQLGQAFSATITASYLGEIPTAAEPVRIAIESATGNIFVSSPSSGSIKEYDQNGDLINEITGLDTPLSVAVAGNGRLFVGDSGDGSVSFYDFSGGSFQYVGELGAGAGEFGLPGDIAVSQSGKVYVTDSVNNKVKVYNATSGAYEISFGSFGTATGQFNFPAGIACDDANQEIYVVDQINGRVQVFDFNRNYKRSVGTFGGGNGRLTRAQGVFVTSGFVYVADAYQSSVEVFKSNGTFVTFIGSYGSDAGLLRIPMDVALYGQTLYVTNSDNMRIEAFDISYFSSISGSLKTSGGAGIPGVLMTLSGAGDPLTATTDISGNYTINNVPAGSYTLTPSATGFTFSAPLNLVVTGPDLTSQNFTAASYIVSGAVTTSSGAGVSTVRMDLTGTNTNGGAVNKTVTSTTTGTYIITDLLPGSYTLTPSKAGYTFTPASVTVINGNITQNFSVTTYSISGSVTNGVGTGISAVTMSITIGTTAKTAATAVNGTYTITDVPPGSYTVKPTKSGYVFTPANQAVTVSAAIVTGVNFNSFTLSGTVTTSNNTAISGVIMTLSGGGMTSNKTATTSATGTYSIPGLGNGTYTLTPSKAGYTFTPISVTINNADVTQNISMTTYSISGAVTTGGSVGISGVTMTITIGTTAKTALTGIDGSYTITDVPSGSYTVTPSKTGGYAFTPANQAAIVSAANVTGVNFKSFTLSGTVKTSTGTNLSGVLMTLSGGGLTTNKTATTATAGTYSIPGLGNGTYTLTPSKAGYTFTPVSVTINNADQTQDVTVQVYSISGTVTTGGGVGISTVTMSITIGATAKTASTATDGSYTITDVPSGSYTVTPSKTGGYVFTPANQAVTVDTANVTGVNFNSFTLTGTVKTSTGTNLSGVLMTLSGGGLTTNKTATTATAGTYSIPGLGNGTYTLTPSKAGYTFTPASVTISNADQTQDFTVQVYSISGAVTTGGGVGISAVTMTITIGTTAKTASTATNGSYTITDVPSGSYTVTPTKTGGYVFTPANQAVTVDTANVTGVNFNSFAILGTVKTSTGTNLSGVLITLSGGGLTTNKTATTATAGTYSIPGLGNGTYTLTPSKAGYTFTPASVTISNADQTQDFTVQVYSISGAVTTGGGVGISTVTMTITIGTTAKTASTATNGSYTITDVPVGSYTVTPSKTGGYVFTPANQAVTISTANVTGVNFNSFTLSGIVKTSNNTAISGVLMTLSGGGLTTNKTATTPTAGTYSIPGLGNGTYTLTPSKAGYTFTPVSVTINNADQTQDFTVQVYSISGAVTTGGGVGISAVTMSITIGATAKTASTATNGSYTITDVPVGSYTVTPSKTGGYVFTPANQAVTVDTANVTDVNFNSFVLSGTVKTSTGTNISGVLMTLSGGGLTTNKTATTPTAGTYSFPGLGNGVYTLKPSKAGYTFTPASKVVTISDADFAQNFTGAVAGTTPMNIIAAAKGPDATNDAVIRIVDLSGSLISEFQTLSTLYGARVAMGDLLGDGEYEVIVAPGNASQNQALMKIYSYSGTLLASLPAVANTVYGSSVVAGDIDGDGKDEIVMSRLSADMITHTISIYGVGIDYSLTQKASFSLISSAPVTAPADIAVGELNGADNLELIVSYMTGDGTTNRVNVYTLDATMNQTLTAFGSYPLGSTVSALNLGGGVTEDIALGYTDGYDSIVRFMDASLVDVGVPMTAFVNGGSAPTLSTMDIDGDGELDLLAGMGDKSDNPALLTIYPSAGIPTDITVFEISVRGVNADFGVIKK